MMLLIIEIILSTQLKNNFKINYNKKRAASIKANWEIACLRIVKVRKKQIKNQKVKKKSSGKQI